MSRERILKSPAYWIAKVQLALFNCAQSFMERNGMNRTQLAAHLGVSKGFVSQLLNGEFDYKLSSLIKLALSFGYVPSIEFRPVSEVVESDKISSCSVTFTPNSSKCVTTIPYIPSGMKKSNTVSFDTSMFLIEDGNNDVKKTA